MYKNFEKRAITPGPGLTKNHEHLFFIEIIGSKFHWDDY